MLSVVRIRFYVIDVCMSSYALPSVEYVCQLKSASNRRPHNDRAELLYFTVSEESGLCEVCMRSYILDNEEFVSVIECYKCEEFTPMCINMHIHTCLYTYIHTYIQVARGS